MQDIIPINVYLNKGIRASERKPNVIHMCSSSHTLCLPTCPKTSCGSIAKQTNNTDLCFCLIWAYLNTCHTTYILFVTLTVCLTINVTANMSR